MAKSNYFRDCAGTSMPSVFTKEVINAIHFSGSCIYLMWVERPQVSYNFEGLYGHCNIPFGVVFEQRHRMMILLLSETFAPHPRVKSLL